MSKVSRWSFANLAVAALVTMPLVAWSHDAGAQGQPGYMMPMMGQGGGMMGQMPGQMMPMMMGSGMMGGQMPMMMGSGMMGGQMPMMTSPGMMGGQMPMMMGSGMMGGQMPMMACPGMMGGQMPMMMGSGMMGGQMPMTMSSGMTAALPEDLSVDQVRHMLDHGLQWQGGGMKLGKVEEKDADTIVAEILAADGSPVQHIEVNRHTGWMQQAQ